MPARTASRFPGSTQIVKRWRPDVRSETLLIEPREVDGPVVHRDANAPRLDAGENGVALPRIHPDREEVAPGRHALRHDREGNARRLAERSLVAAADLLAALEAFRELRKLRQKERRVHVREVVLVAEALHVPVLVFAGVPVGRVLRHAVRAELPHQALLRPLARRDRAALAAREVLRRVEAEAAVVGEPPGPEAVATPLDAVRGVFDEHKAAAVGETPERDHVGHEAVEVDGDDRLRTRRDRRRDGGGIDVRGRGIDVYENRRPARVYDRIRRGQKRHRRRDDLVQRADARREHGKMQGGRGVCRAHDGGHTAILLEGLLEGIDPLPRGNGDRSRRPYEPQRGVTGAWPANASSVSFTARGTSFGNPEPAPGHSTTMG